MFALFIFATSEYVLYKFDMMCYNKVVTPTPKVL